MSALRSIANLSDEAVPPVLLEVDDDEDVDEDVEPVPPLLPDVPPDDVDDSPPPLEAGVPKLP